MTWATVSTRSCFYWLHRASPFSTAKNVINLISELTIWWCSNVELSLELLERVFAMTIVFSWQNSISLCPSSFCIVRLFLPVILGISWLPTFAFQYLMIKRTFFFLILTLEGFVLFTEPLNFNFFSIIGWCIDLDYCDGVWFTC